MRPWLNWIEHQISNLRVASSNLAGRTIRKKNMKLFKPFGPSIGKIELKKTTISNVNDYCDKIMLSKSKSKKLDHSSKLVANVE